MWEKRSKTTVKNTKKLEFFFCLIAKSKSKHIHNITKWKTAGIEQRTRRRKTELAARPPSSPLLLFPVSGQFREPTPTQLAAEPERLPPIGQSPSSPQPVTRKFCVIKHDI